MWSDWAGEAFGEQVDVLREGIPEALALAHRRARAVHDAGQSRNNRVYGYALLDFAHEEVVAAVREVAGGRVARLGAYELAVIAGKALFPLHYSEKAEPLERARLRKPVSGVRRRLFEAHAAEVPDPDPFLDDSWAGLELADSYEPFPQLGRNAELVVIAYACNVEAGLLSIDWGYAEHVGDGELRWGAHSSLPLPSASGLVPAARDGRARFDAAAQPGLELGLRAAEEGARHA